MAVMSIPTARAPSLRLAVTVLAGVAVLFPLVVRDEYALHVAILTLLSAMMGLGWNILGGYAGQLSIGHAAFFGIGAYGTTLLFQNWGWPPWFGGWLGAALAAALSVPIGVVCFRLRGPYLTVATIAFAEITRMVAVNWKSLTHGAEGILIDRAPKLWLPGIGTLELVAKEPYYYIILAMLAGTWAFTRWLAGSRTGYYLMALREDQDAAEALGIDSLRYKLLALALSAFVTGLAGSFFAFYTSHIEPETTFSIDKSVEMALVSIIGGLGTTTGPIVGAVVLTLLAEALRAIFLQAHLLVYGLLVIGVVLFLPEGILGGLHRLFLRRWVSDASEGRKAL
jgi:branched-chain amino acid transport system permease protein